MKKLFTFILAVAAHAVVSAQNVMYSSALEDAAADGDIEAVFNLGECYFYGNGIERDFDKAARLYEKAVKGGHDYALYRLGVCYSNGSGVPADKLYAAYLYRQGAERKVSSAMNNLAALYFNNDAIPANWQNGFYWYCRGALEGNMAAISNAGNCLNNGRGTVKDLTRGQLLADAYDLMRGGFTDDAMAKVRKALGEESDPDFTGSFHPDMVIGENSVRIVDASGDNVINPMEKAFVNVTVHNRGNADGRGCVVKLNCDVPGVFVDDYVLPLMPAGTLIKLKIPIFATRHAVNMSGSVGISVYEPNGFDCIEEKFPVRVASFAEPLVKITDFGIAQKCMTAAEPADLEVVLSNVKEGVAENVCVSIECPDDVFVIEGDETVNVGSMAGGACNKLKYRIMASNNYVGSCVPVKFNIRESHGMYAESRTIDIPIGDGAASDYLVVESKGDEGDIARAQLKDKQPVSDVDRDIPLSPNADDETFALIIANEDYRREPDVEFAHNDGSTFAIYCRRTLGISPDHIRVLKDATYNEMRNEVKWLADVARSYNGRARLIFYYAGHGVPDEKTREAYLLPSDGFSSDISTGYKVSSLYGSLSECNAKDVMVFLDACFSGAKRSDNGDKAARAVAITPKTDSPRGNMVVFAAAQGDETAFPYREKYHGMFTYYLLKKLQLSRGSLSVGELGSYIRQNVSQKSIVVNKKSQTPSVSASGSMGDGWKDIRIKY